MTAPLIGDLAVEVTDWFEQLQVQGLVFSLEAQAKKFLGEAQELADEPHRMEEAADVFVSLMGTLWVQGKDLQDLAQAVQDKLVVLRQRTWALQPDGTYQHVRGCQECGNDDGPHQSNDGRRLCLDCMEDTL